MHRKPVLRNPLHQRIPENCKPMIIFFLIVLVAITPASGENMTRPLWMQPVGRISAEINDHLRNEITSEPNPPAEGFMMSIAPKKKALLFNTNTTTSRPILATTCYAVTITNALHPPAVNPRLSRSAHELAPIVPRATSEDENEMRSFLDVDDDKLADELMNSRALIDGSGETTSDSTEQPTETSSDPTESTTDLPTTATVVSTSSITPEGTHGFTDISTESLNTTVSDPSSSIVAVTTATGTSTRSATTRPLPEILPDFNKPTKIKFTLNCNDSNSTVQEMISIAQPLFNAVPVAGYPCNDTGTFEIELMSAGLFSLNDLTNLLMKLEQLGIDSGIKIDIVDRCVGREVEPLENVNSCFLIELCDLCGRPARGECKPQGNFSRCICYVNTLDPTAQFEGDLCSVPLRSGSKAPRWTPVVVGILSALALLLGIVTCCLLALACWHFFPYEKSDVLIRRIWHLPRAVVPNNVSEANAEPSTNDSSAAPSSPKTPSDRDDTLDNSFFDDLDQHLNDNLPEDIITNNSDDDPIHELDAIIDHEDSATPFHDALDFLEDEPELAEFFNPNLNIPRASLDFDDPEASVFSF